MVTSQAPAGWYPDPSGIAGGERYWDGRAWTSWTRPSPAWGPFAGPPAPGMPPSAGMPPSTGLGPSTGMGPPTGLVPTNGLAIASLACAVGAVVAPGIGSVLGVVFGHIALRQIARTGEGGRNLAVAGLVVGYIGAALAILAVAVIAVV
ncbi:MAG TPA: DUF4190 domain-containing protein, partial [Acidimicrobiales bacterium]|nr:DUF4190 domain-containing protein [Acidimicrobiales bacterium]